LFILRLVVANSEAHETAGNNRCQEQDDGDSHHDTKSWCAQAHFIVATIGIG